MATPKFWPLAFIFTNAWTENKTFSDKHSQLSRRKVKYSQTAFSHLCFCKQKSRRSSQGGENHWSSQERSALSWKMQSRTWIRAGGAAKKSSETRSLQPGVHVPLGVHLPNWRDTFKVDNRREKYICISFIFKYFIYIYQWISFPKPILGFFLNALTLRHKNGVYLYISTKLKVVSIQWIFVLLLSFLS